MKQKKITESEGLGEVIFLNFEARRNLRKAQGSAPDFVDSVRAMITSLEEKDSYTHGHSLRVAEFSVLLAQELQLSEIRVREVELSALLHDIGKIGIPDAVLLKSAKLSSSEFSLMKSHPDRSERILSRIASLQGLIPGIKYHHERFDGQGYPDGLSGENIPLTARIILIADTYDAITSTRPYRLALNKEAAFAELQRCSGTQFDPILVDAFLRAMERREPNSRQDSLKKAS